MPPVTAASGGAPCPERAAPPASTVVPAAAPAANTQLLAVSSPSRSGCGWTTASGDSGLWRELSRPRCQRAHPAIVLNQLCPGALHDRLARPVSSAPSPRARGPRRVHKAYSPPARPPPGASTNAYITPAVFMRADLTIIGILRDRRGLQESGYVVFFEIKTVDLLPLSAS